MSAKREISNMLLLLIATQPSRATATVTERAAGAKITALVEFVILMPLSPSREMRGYPPLGLATILCTIH
jgi:hypothetical protein